MVHHSARQDCGLTDDYLASDYSPQQRTGQEPAVHRQVGVSDGVTGSFGSCDVWV